MPILPSTAVSPMGLQRGLLIKRKDLSIFDNLSYYLAAGSVCFGATAKAGI
jgi:hypothetical protein